MLFLMGAGTCVNAVSNGREPGLLLMQFRMGVGTFVNAMFTLRSLAPIRDRVNAKRK